MIMVQGFEHKWFLFLFTIFLSAPEISISGVWCRQRPLNSINIAIYSAKLRQYCRKCLAFDASSVRLGAEQLLSDILGVFLQMIVLTACNSTSAQSSYSFRINSPILINTTPYQSSKHFINCFCAHIKQIKTITNWL